MRFLVALFLFSVLALAYGSSLAPDLPPPAGQTRTPTMVTFAPGSLIIDMGDYQFEDTTVAGVAPPLKHQLTIGHVYPCGQTSTSINCTTAAGSPTCSTNSWCDTCQRVNASRAGQFNLYAYGLAVRILYQKIPLFWAIASGKTSSNSYDISNVGAYRCHPARAPSSSLSANAWGSTSNGTMSFRGGPIIIRAADAPAAMQVLTDIKNNYGASLKGRFESIVIFNLTTTASIDIRHNLTHLPYVYSSTLDGSWCDWSPIPMILMNAGLIEGPINNVSLSTNDLNQHHWSLLTNSADLIAFSNNTCSTLFAEPHIIFDDSGNCASGRCVSTPQYRAPLTEFVQSGGNFWVQCAGVASYENSLWDSQYYPPTPSSKQIGAFISKYGVQGLGNKGNEWGGRIDGTWVYANPDLPVSQFVGNLGNATGTISGFYLRNDPSPSTPDASLWANNGFSIAYSPLQGGSSTAPYNALSISQGNMQVCTRCCPANNPPACTYNNTLPASRTAHIAAGAKLTNPYNANSQLGGLVWMIGGHSWFTTYSGSTDSSYPSDRVENISLKNGQRMLLNALLVPAVRPANCLHNFCSQDVDCTYQYGTGYSCLSSTCSASASPSISWSVSRTPSISQSASRSPTPSISLSGSKSLSSSISFSVTSSVTPSSTISRTSTASATPSRSQSPSISHSSGASQSNTQTPSTTISNTQTPSTTISRTQTASTTPSLSRSITPSSGASSSPSVSVTPSTSLSRSPSYSPSTSRSNTPSTSHSASRSVTPSASASPVVIAVGGGGGDNTGTIVGAVVGSVGGVAVVAGVVAAGAAAAVVAVKKSASTPLDSGAMSGNDMFTNTEINPAYTPSNLVNDNPLYLS